MRGLVVDLFAGGGGASAGIERALGRAVDLAINHDPVALARVKHPESGPLGTIHAGGNNFALVNAFLAKHYGGVVGIPATEPLSTVTATDHHSVVTATMVEPGQRHGRGQAAAEAPLSTDVGWCRGGRVRACVARMEDGDVARLPDLGLLHKLAAALDVQPRHLLYDPEDGDIEAGLGLEDCRELRRYADYLRVRARSTGR